jgi:hypothetical protein
LRLKTVSPGKGLLSFWKLQPTNLIPGLSGFRASSPKLFAHSLLDTNGGPTCRRARDVCPEVGHHEQETTP